MKLLLFCSMVVLASSAVPLFSQTHPVGFYTFSAPTGTRATGISLPRNSIASGTVDSKSGSLLVAVEIETNFGALLTAKTAYYLEVTGGAKTTYVGDRFDLNTGSTIASSDNSVTINNASSNNTRKLPDLTGYTFVIRRHVTLASAFGSKGTTVLTGGKTASASDQVKFYNPAKDNYTTYFLYQSGSETEWRKSGGGSTSFDNLVIPAGTGVFLKRVGTHTVKLTFSGTVRQTPFFAQKLNAGANFICEGYPVNTTLKSRDLTVANGFTGSKSAKDADQLGFWNGTSFVDYFLFKSATKEQWRKVSGGTKNYSNSSSLINYSGAFFIDKVKADPNYAAPKPF